MKKLRRLYLLIFLSILFSISHTAAGGNPPGVVVYHVSKDTELYVGSPSICVLPTGEYIASHDVFGPKSTEYQSAMTFIYISLDKGETWTRQTGIQGQFWSNLFSFQGDLYIMGTNKHHGNVILRKSADKGKTWTIPYSPNTGLLLEGEYHTAPTPVLIHKDRIWRAVEYATAKTTRWGQRYSAMMFSAPLDSDIMDANNWTTTNKLGYDSTFVDGKFEAWLEGNAVAMPNGQVCNVLRVASGKQLPEYIAIAEVDSENMILKFDEKKGFIPFNGGSKKFTIRYDEKTKRYWTLVNYVSKLEEGIAPASVRNQQVLCSSDDMITWEAHKTILEHPDVKHHAFQYVDWNFDNSDIIFVSRTAYDDETGGAFNAHNANYLTFHRITDYASLTKIKIEK